VDRKAMGTVMVLDHSWPDEIDGTGVSLQERLSQFDIRFARCYGLLHLIASRVLGSSEGAEEAIENCRVAASHNAPVFEHDGAFRCWLVRMVMDEALAFRRRKSIY
jgi:DNA-directed RNA polymerase specialized sigma24 family protein